VPRGVDGLPAEFYKSFWNILGEDFYHVIGECFEKGILPSSCQRAVLSLLPKTGDLGLLKNWRPVSLMCQDNRLNMTLSIIVRNEQTYCVPRRTIMDNLFLIRDVMDLSMNDDFNIGFLSIDQEKAFDRVGHEYLLNVLKVFGFGENFISWIQLLYRGASVILKVGGGLSCPIPARRGIRQGCPISGQLYSLVIEPLLIKLRNNLNGFHIPGDFNGSSVSVSAYADDVTVFITGQGDIQILSKS